MLVKLKEILPIISIILIWFGFVQVYSYYKYFNIDITYYLTLDQYLLFLLPNFLTLIISSTNLIWLALIIGSKVNFTQEVITEYKNNFFEISNKSRFLFLFLVYLPAIIICILISINYLRFKGVFLEISIFNVLPIVWMFVGIQVILLLVIYKFEFLVFSKYLIMILSLLLTSFYFYTYNQKKAYLTKNNYIKTKYMLIEFNDKFISTKDSSIYIGETKEFMFIMYKKSNALEIIQKDKLKSIVLLD